MQNQLLQPWELCRWFSYSSSKEGSQNSLKTPRQRTLPGSRLTRSLGPRAEAEASVGVPQDAVPVRRSLTSRPGPKLEPFPSFSGGNAQEGEGKPGQLDLTPLSWEVLSGD